VLSAAGSALSHAPLISAEPANSSEDYFLFFFIKIINQFHQQWIRNEFFGSDFKMVSGPDPNPDPNNLFNSTLVAHLTHNFVPKRRSPYPLQKIKT
jgi:hypothetical protein